MVLESIKHDIADLDSNLELFNTKAGTVNLATGELKPHSKSDLITKISPVTEVIR